MHACMHVCMYVCIPPGRTFAQRFIGDFGYVGVCLDIMQGCFRVCSGLVLMFRVSFGFVYSLELTFLGLFWDLFKFDLKSIFRILYG